MRGARLGAAAALAVLAIPAATVATGTASSAFRDAPPPAFTGGFGEASCAQCHFDVAVPDPAGAVTVTGLPERYTAGERYLLTLRLQRPGMERAGFEVSARFASGAGAGSQAGALHPSDARTALTAHGGVDYLHHAAAGTEPMEDGSTSWEVEWTAPPNGDTPVIFHLAANAADGDDSQLGDHVYLDSVTISPPAAPQGARHPCTNSEDR